MISMPASLQCGQAVACEIIPGCKDEYNKAIDLKPSESYPKRRLRKLIKYWLTLKHRNRKDDQYKGLIEKADKLLTENHTNRQKRNSRMLL